MENKKIEVLCLCDSPTCATGFAQVSKNILKMLYDTKKYRLTVVGINHDGRPYDREKYPYEIWPASNYLIQDTKYHDLFGRQLFLDKLGTGDYDLVWVLQDTFQLLELSPLILKTNNALPPNRKFKTIFYFPIDATPKKEWVDTLLFIDYPIAYTQYAYDECLKQYGDSDLLPFNERTELKERYDLLKAKMQIVYHGVNVKDFYPIESKEKVKELRAKYFGKQKDKFIFMNINRNQPRKDLFRSLQAAKMLSDRRKAKGLDDVYFYFHCQYFDNTGLNLIDMSKQLQFTAGDQWGFPNPKMFGANQGYTLEVVNEFYNSVDAIFSTTLGEGFGLSVIEGMATKKPIIFPNNTCLPELLGGGGERGILAKSGSCQQEFVVNQMDNDRLRAVTNLEDLVDKMEYLVDNREKFEPMIERAYKFATDKAWEGNEIGDKWRYIFGKAWVDCLETRKLATEEYKTDFNTLSRNDICPICSKIKGKDVKFKNCIHFNKE